MHLSLETLSKLCLIPLHRLQLLEQGLDALQPNERELLSQIFGEAFSTPADEVIGVSEPATPYHRSDETAKETILNQLRAVFSNEPKMRQAWIFGSFAHTSKTAFRDIDLAINTDEGFSYFDLADLQYQLQQATGKKIDIGFADSLALIPTATSELPKLIYAR